MGGEVKKENDIYAFGNMFEMVFAKQARNGECNHIDPAADNYRVEILEFGSRPDYIALGLDHQYDELHTYDGFYDEHDEKLWDAVNRDEIYSSVYQAINCRECGHGL